MRLVRLAALVLMAVALAACSRARDPLPMTGERAVLVGTWLSKRSIEAEGQTENVVLIINGESAINSVCHLWGARRFDTRDTSRNNALVAIWTLGEGWHNNHHHHMGSANHGFCWWEVDVTYYLIRLLQLLGIVWDVRVAPPLLSKRRTVVSAVTPGE